MFIPTAFQISTMYRPTTWIFFRSPPILLFICANQSATLRQTQMGEREALFSCSNAAERADGFSLGQRNHDLE
jgi:hypothetical protein